MANKLTRREALCNVIAFLRDNEQYGDDWSEDIAVLDNMPRARSLKAPQDFKMSLSPASLLKFSQKRGSRFLQKT